MNNLNSFTPASINKINALVDKINATCDALISALDFNTESVSSYNMTIVDRMNMNSEFIDRVVTNIVVMKTHLSELKKGMEIIEDTLDLKNIVSGLQDTSDKLNELLINDNNFNNVYSMAVMEIQDMIGQVMDEIRVGEVVLK
ncbi:MAG TPA: hypothetical protein P5060_01030 [Candidatus Absconditabacterales bacterium]|nr:hypothetical protein [Candidatus Absconditabacterales bacterium]